MIELREIEMNNESEERLNMAAVFDSPNFLHGDFF